MSTVGNNIDETERMLACFVGAENAVCLSCGTAALHLALRLAGERLYGVHRAKEGTLSGRRVFCSDMTFSATVNPVAYEGGEAVFIETEYDTWNMDPAALRKAFETYPDTRLVVLAHLYGTPGKIDEIRDICKAYGALLVEDAAESMGAVYKGRQTGSLESFPLTGIRLSQEAREARSLPIPNLMRIRCGNGLLRVGRQRFGISMKSWDITTVCLT